MEEAIQESAVLKEKIAEIFIYGKNAVPVWNTDQFKRHTGSALHGIKVFDEIGTVSNLSLMRLGDARKCIFVEGKDLKLLTKIAEVVLNEKIPSLETLPHVSLNGYNNLREAFGALKLFYEETKGMIQCICILDSDYFPEDLIKEKHDIFMQELERFVDTFEDKVFDQYAEHI